jgi:hypothetical protein
MVQPSGENISKFIVTDALPPETKTAVERVLKIVDSIHGVDTMPVLPVAARRIGKGRYTYKGGVLKLTFNPDQPDAELTLLHELGHFIDHHGFNPFREASASDEVLAQWRNTVEKTESVIALRKSVSRKTKYADFCKYLLQPAELWARSYAQFITMQSQDDSLRKQLRLYQKSLIFEDRFQHWSDADFKTTYNSILNIFGGQRWIN